MESAVGIEVFTTRSAAKLTGVTLATIERWDASGFVSPSVLGADGRGSRRVYSFRDVVALCVAVHLRELGVKIETLRLVVKHLQKRKGLSASEPLPPSLLVTDGSMVFELGEAASLAALRKPGRRVCTVVPLDELVDELQQAARLLRQKEAPTSHKSENSLVQRAASRARRAA